MCVCADDVVQLLEGGAGGGAEVDAGEDEGTCAAAGGTATADAAADAWREER